MSDVTKLMWVAVGVLVAVMTISIAYFVINSSGESRRGVTTDMQNTYSDLTTTGLDSYVGQTVTGQTVRKVIKDYFDVTNRTAVRFSVSLKSADSESGYYKFSIFQDSDISDLTNNEKKKYVDASAKFNVLARKDENDRTIGLDFIEE